MSSAIPPPTHVPSAMYRDSFIFLSHQTIIIPKLEEKQMI
jgi:hypothetical protein